MSYLDRLRELCLGWEGVFEDYPFGPGATVFKAPSGKMIALASDAEADRQSVSLKLTPAEAEEALLLPFVRPAPYLARHHWVTCDVSNDAEWEIAAQLVARSRDLVSAARGRRR